MYTSSPRNMLAFAGAALALTVEVGIGSSDACSAWQTVADDLMNSFVDSSGSCTDNARAAIRMSFHDCFPEACDGSLILTDECSGRPENAQMVPTCTLLGDKASSYGVSAADLVQLGGSLGTHLCKGPLLKFLVGRQDATSANPTGQLPPGNTAAEDLISIFAAKGFSADELVALVGSHSAAKNLAGAALDTTVDTLDSQFYTETAEGSTPASIPSDQFLANATETQEKWNSFGKNNAQWTGAFTAAMEKMMVMGNDAGSLTDCTSVVTSAVASKRRAMRKH